MIPLVSVEEAAAHLEVEAASGTPEETKLTLLVDAISERIRRSTHRGFEGEPTVYDELYTMRGRRDLVLEHVPVDAVFSVREAYFDGSEAPIHTPLDVAGGITAVLMVTSLAGDDNLKLGAIPPVGTLVRIGAGGTQEVVRVKSAGTAGAAGPGADIEPRLRFPQLAGVSAVEVARNLGYRWRLEDSQRGRIALRTDADYLRVVYRVTGEVPAPIRQAALEWLSASWQRLPDATPDDPELASQSSDGWSESYREIPVAPTPPKVGAAITSYWHATTGGPI